MEDSAQPQLLTLSRKNAPLKRGVLRPAITAQIAPLRKRIKRLNHIRKDAQRLLNLLRTELRREYEIRHPVKEQQRQRTRNYEPER
jgi:hypothetical protein